MNQPHATPWQQPPPPPAPTPKRPRRWPWILGIVAAFMLGLFIGIGTSGSPTPSSSNPGGTVAPVPSSGSGSPVTQAPPPTETKAAPKTEFGDGTYLVGTDIAAGSYKTSGPRAGSTICYWARLKDDSGSNIIANNAGQGAARLTVKAGEYLQITGCDWTRA